MNKKMQMVFSYAVVIFYQLSFLLVFQTNDKRTKTSIKYPIKRAKNAWNQSENIFTKSEIENICAEYKCYVFTIHVVKAFRSFDFEAQYTKNGLRNQKQQFRFSVFCGICVVLNETNTLIICIRFSMLYIFSVG